MEDRTLMDILQPFRKALQPEGASKESAETPLALPPRHPLSAAATKLDFGEALESCVAKRKSRFEPSPPPAKKPKGESPWQVNRYRAEALESRSQIERLEQQIAHQHTVRQEMETLFDNERQILVAERRNKEAALVDTERRLETARAKETELRERLVELDRELTKLRHAAEKDRQATQAKISHLENELTDAKNDADAEAAELRRRAADATRESDESKRDVERYRTAYERASAEAQQTMTLRNAYDKQTLVLQQTELKLRELEANKRDLDEVKILQKRLVNMPSLEREVAQLREEATELRAAARQNMLLEEQVQYYKKRIDTTESLYQNYCDLQKSYGELQRSLDDWKRVGEAYECSDPNMLIEQLEKFQSREISLVSDKRDIDVLLSSTKTELINTKHECKKTQSKLTDVQSIQKTQESFIHRLQKKLLLVSRERDSYRQQLDSYEKELTVNIGPELHQPSAMINGRIEGLEKALQGYKDLVTKLEEDMAAFRGTPTLQDQLSRLKDEIMNLTKENEILRLHTDKIDMQLEQNVSTKKEKILHLVQNPYSRAQEETKNELQRAYSEIQSLKYRIKKLEANELEITQRLAETTTMGGPSSEEFNQLKEQLESKKMKLERMKELFTSSSQEFKDVCYMLMGYKIDRMSVNNYRLSSLYAESPDEYLNFKLTDGAIEMIQTEYSMTIDHLVEEHLQRHKSFPVFLSELTLDLFKRTTIVSDSTLQ